MDDAYEGKILFITELNNIRGYLIKRNTLLNSSNTKLVLFYNNHPPDACALIIYHLKIVNPGTQLV